MINLIRAEFQKIIENRMLTSFTLWVWPVGNLAFFLAIILSSMVTPRETPIFPVSPWDKTMLSAWLTLTNFPFNVTMRLFVVAFMAIFIAGEYEWQTWKNIVPHRRRALIMAAKFFVLSGMMVLSIAITSLIMGVGMGVYASVSGQECGPVITGQVLGDFLLVYLFEAVVACGTVLLMAGFCALASLLTRTIVGGLLLGLGLSIIESVSGFLLSFVAFVFDKPWISNLFAYMPTYNIDNIRSWYHFGSAWHPAYIPGFGSEPTLVASIILLALWIIGLMALSIIVFQHQDLAA